MKQNLSAPKASSTESRPGQEEDLPRRRTSSNTASNIHTGDQSSWEALDRLKDECEANEALVRDAFARRDFAKAAIYHLSTIKLKQQLSPRFPFSDVARVQASIKQLEIVLKCDKAPGDISSLLPPQVEDLLHTSPQPHERDDHGNLCALLGAYYMRSPDHQHQDLARQYLNLALTNLVEVWPLPVPLIITTAQSLVDLDDLLEDRGSAQGLLKWLERKITSDFTDSVEIGRISSAKLWCQGKGFNVQRFDEVDSSMGCSPLAHAVVKNSSREVEIMLSFTQRTSYPNDLPSELLLLAAGTRSSDMAKLLIDHGARVDIKNTDEDGRTVLHRCQHCPELGNQGGLKIADLFMDRCGDLLDRQDNSGKTALYMACESGHVKMAQKLLERHANPDVVEVNGKTPLYAACEKIHLEIVQLLLEHGGDPNIKGPGGCTPLVVSVMAAAKKAETNRRDVVQKLVDGDADPRITDNTGRDAFQHITGLFRDDLKRILMDSPRLPLSKPSSGAKSTPPPSVKSESGSSRSGTGTKTLKGLFRQSTGASTSSKSIVSSILTRPSRPQSSAATSSVGGKSSRLSLFTTATSISAPPSEAGNDVQQLNRELSRLHMQGKKPDIRRNESPGLQSIPERRHPRRPEVVGAGNPASPLGYRGFEPGRLSSFGMDRDGVSGYGELITDRHPQRQSFDSPMIPMIRGALSVMDEDEPGPKSSLDASSLLTGSETSSDLVSEPLHSYRQNLPRTLEDLFPGVSQDTYRQQAGGSQSRGYGGQGWHMQPSGSAGTSGFGQGGGFGGPPAGERRVSRDSDGNGEQPRDENANGSQAEPGKSLSFACPFAKAATARYFDCNFHTLRRIKDVKQHLHRCHTQPEHCPRCLMPTRSVDETAEHVRAGGCALSNEPPPDGMTKDQVAALRRRVNSRLPHSEQWYEVFRIVFPRAPRSPLSPYVDPDYGLFEFASENARPVVEDFIRDRGYAGRPDTEDIKAVILLGVHHTIRAFLGGRLPTPEPEPAGPEAECSPQSTMPQAFGEANLHPDHNQTVSPISWTSNPTPPQLPQLNPATTLSRVFTPQSFTGEGEANQQLYMAFEMNPANKFPPQHPGMLQPHYGLVPDASHMMDFDRMDGVRESNTTPQTESDEEARQYYRM